MKRALLLYNVLALLVTQTPSPTLLAEDYFKGATQQEIFVAAYGDATHATRTILVLHARETENETDADIQIWPSGRVKLKHPESLDRASLDFWRGLTLADGVKREICR